MKVYWYDSVCFAIVAISFIGAWLAIWKKERRPSRTSEGDANQSLLVSRPWGYLSSSQLWTSCWKGVHPRWLLATRFVCFALTAGCLTFDLVDSGPVVMVYYTEWSFALVAVYFLLGTIVSGYGCWLLSMKPPCENGARAELLRKDLEDGSTENSTAKGVKETHNGSFSIEEIEQRVGAWGYLMQIAYQTCGGAVIITDIVFWSIIVPFLTVEHIELNLLMGLMHTLNLFFLLLDSSLNNLSFPWFRLAYFVIWSCMYAVFQWIIHACGFPWWSYPFIDLETPWAPLWYFLLAVAHVPCYGIYVLIIKAKNSILPRFFPHSFIRS